MNIIDVTKGVAGKVSNLSKRNVAESAIGTGVGILALCGGIVALSTAMYSRWRKRTLEEQIEEDRDELIHDLTDFSILQSKQLSKVIDLLTDISDDVNYLMAKDYVADFSDDEYEDFEESDVKNNDELKSDEEDEE